MANRLLNVDDIYTTDGKSWIDGSDAPYRQMVMDHDTSNGSTTPDLANNPVLLASGGVGDFQWTFIHSDNSKTVLDFKNLGVDTSAVTAGSGTYFLADQTNWDSNGTEATILEDPTGELAKTFQMPDGNCALNHVPFAGGPSYLSGGTSNYEYNSLSALQARAATRTISNNGSISIRDRSDCCSSSGYGDWCGGNGYNGRHWWRVWGTHYLQVGARCHNNSPQYTVSFSEGITKFQILMK